MSDRMDELIDGLYDAATDASHWPAVLAEAASLLNAQGAEIGHMDARNSNLSFLISHGYVYTAERVQRYQELMPEDPRLPVFLGNPFRPIHCRMIVGDDELRATRVYREVLAPDGIEYTLGVSLIEDDETSSFFAALRGPDGPPFGDEECRLLEALVPHLRRALRIYRRFALLDLDRMAALEGLDQIAVGIVVARADGALICANRAAEDLLRSAKNLAVEDGRLQARTAAGDEQIRRALSRAVRPVTEKAVHSVRISDQGCAEGLQMLVAKLPGRREPRSLALSPHDLVALVFEADSFRHLQRWERLQHAFGLLASEAKLVELLVNGASLAEAAEQLSLKTGSARQYLKRVFQKIDVNRQSDLVRKVLSSPVWMQYPAEP